MPENKEIIFTQIYLNLNLLSKTSYPPQIFKYSCVKIISLFSVRRKILDLAKSHKKF